MACAQNKKPTYTQFDITAAITGNPNRDQVNEYTHEKEPWLMPDGIGTKLGYGLHYKKWVALGIHSGID